MWCLFTFTLLVVSFTKSAQVPFSSWLPAAMLAPTPVSALVHSSTLVTAGVYLLFRYAHSSSRFLVWRGILTLLVAGFSACLEADLKKIVALSTLSHLGLIVFRLGLGFRRLAFLHLNIHGSFIYVCWLSHSFWLWVTGVPLWEGSCFDFTSSFVFVLGITVFLVWGTFFVWVGVQGRC